MGADDDHLRGFAGAGRGVQFVGEVGEAEAPPALAAIERVRVAAAIEPAEAVMIPSAHATDVVVVPGEIIVFGGADGTRADGVVAFEEVGVFAAEGACAVLAGIGGRARAATPTAPEGAAIVGHGVTVAGCAMAGQRGEGACLRPQRAGLSFTAPTKEAV